MFDQLIHADWSVTPGKRWVAVAERRTARWTVSGPELVGPAGALLERAFAAAAEGQRLLVGFDFPIGVPAAYGALTKLESFRHLLHKLGGGEWSQFFEVAKSPSDIRISRPFYPLVSKKGVSRAELVAGLGVRSFDDLLRVCERRTEYRRAACSLFWTLGGNQVGKGALTGWQEIIRPALQRGAALWPFDGTLPDLANAPGVVLAETYPAEAYRMVNAGFRHGESKRRQADRRSKGAAVLAWAERHGIVFSADASAALNSGFGSQSNGEDQFDAAMGPLKMIEVTDGRRVERERTKQPAETANWEGWILGR
jgi:hypothetical protein